MEFLKKLFLQTQNHLKGLTVSQRLAIGSCVALIVVALFWMVRWAGSPAMVPLLDQAMSTQELGAIQQRLEGLGVRYRSVGETLLVPAEDQYRLRAQLAQAQLLPRDTSIGFARLIEQNSSPWLNMAEQDRRWVLAKSNELARVLREFDGIIEAKVFLDNTVKRTIGQAPIVPTASVFVKPAASGSLSRETVFAMANMVAGAVAGLDPANVKVADMATGRSYSVPRPEDTLAYSDLEDRQKKEAHFSEKVKSLLANIPGLLVAVHAELSEESSEMLEEVYGKPVVVKDRSETEMETRGRLAEEPGVNPNTSVAVGGGGAAESREKTVTETTSDGKVDRKVMKSEKPRHTIEKLFASVNVPRSYLAAIFKRANNGKEPTDEELNQFSKPDLDKITDTVLRALALGDQQRDQVKVNWFPDDASVQFGQVMEGAAGQGMMGLVQAHGGKAALAGLAVISLFMMLMMVRRVSEGPVLPGEEAPSPQVIRMKGRKKATEEVELSVGDEAIGEASVSDPLLVGKEIDERTMHVQKVVEQVVDMVREDPDSAVGVLKRWIDEEQR